ncbi:hypothetical protein U1Q18_029127 [Sarracenia purpurea var. burkii]
MARNLWRIWVILNATALMMMFHQSEGRDDSPKHRNKGHHLHLHLPILTQCYHSSLSLWDLGRDLYQAFQVADKSLKFYLRAKQASIWSLPAQMARNLWRTWIILNATALMMMFHQSEAVMIPHLFAIAMNFPLTKFLQAQSKAMAMAAKVGMPLVLHAYFS